MAPSESIDSLHKLSGNTLGSFALSGMWDERTHWASLWQSACQFIDGNLGDAELSPAMLAAALRCSRTQIYRIFARYGRTVMGYILECRLSCAREMLADPACRHSIASVAWLCGFEDPSAFSRSFRRRFGCQPRDVRRQARSAVLAV